MARLAAVVLAPDRPGGPPLAELGGRVMRLEGAPDLAPGSAVVIELEGGRTTPADGARAVLQRPGAGPVQVTLSAASAPSVLPARAQAPLPAILTGPAQPPLAVAVIVAPAAGNPMPGPASGVAAAFLNGHVVTGTAMGNAAGRVSLGLGSARLELPLTPALLPEATLVSVRLTGTGRSLGDAPRTRSSVSGRQERGGGAPLPRIQLDDGLGGALRRLAATAMADVETGATLEPDAASAAGQPVADATQAMALLGPPGQAMVLGVRVDDEAGEGETRDHPPEAEARVSFEVQLERLGRVRLDVSVTGGVVALAVRSQLPCAPELRAEIGDLFGAACDLDGRTGRLSFTRLQLPRR